MCGVLSFLATQRTSGKSNKADGEETPFKGKEGVWPFWPLSAFSFMYVTCGRSSNCPFFVDLDYGLVSDPADLEGDLLGDAVEIAVIKDGVHAKLRKDKTN